MPKFIRVGERILRKSRIAHIDVSHRKNYRLKILYDLPWWDSEEGCTSMGVINVYYDIENVSDLVADIESITSFNTDVLLGDGVRRMMGHHNDE